MPIEPGNQEALVTLLLALTDQFRDERPARTTAPRDVLAGWPHDYDRAYYAGIVCERRAKAQLPGPGAPAVGVTTGCCEAMDLFERAEALGRRATTTHACAGTRACGSSSAIRS